jgi:hypothetical protein
MAGMSRGELIDLLGGFAAKDPEYMKLLKADPKDVIARQLQTEVPAGVNVKVLEETADTMYIVVPYVAAEGAELSDSDLEAVAGGFADSTEYNCGQQSSSTSRSSQQTQRGNFTHISITSGGTTAT